MLVTSTRKLVDDTCLHGFGNVGLQSLHDLGHLGGGEGDMNFGLDMAMENFNQGSLEFGGGGSYKRDGDAVEGLLGFSWLLSGGFLSLMYNASRVLSWCGLELR